MKKILLPILFMSLPTMAKVYELTICPNPGNNSVAEKICKEKLDLTGLGSKSLFDQNGELINCQTFRCLGTPHPTDNSKGGSKPFRQQ